MSSIALSCARSSHVVTARCAARAFGTETLASGSSSSALHPPSANSPGNSKRQRRELNATDHDGKSVYVRTWDEIGSMPEFFAILRGVEKRFGPVREFRVARDPDISTKYHNYFMLEFADDAAFHRIPSTGTNIKVAVPVIKKDLPGGLGLADLHGLLDAQERDPDLAAEAPENSGGLGLYGAPITVVQDEDRPTRVVEVVVQRAKRDATVFPRARSLYRNRAFGPAFFDWGGFYAPTPEDPRPVPKDMAAALEKWREFAMSAPRRAHRGVQPGEGQEGGQGQGLGEAGGAGMWREAEKARREEEEEKARREEMEVMLRGAEEPEATPLTAPTLAKDQVVQVGAAEKALEGGAEATEGEDAEKGPRLSRKEQILARARLHAKTPAPEVLTEEEVVERVVRKRVEKKREEEAKEAEVSSLRERLMKLVGGKWL